MRFDADSPEVIALRTADPRFEQIIDKVDYLEIEPAKDRFYRLASAIAYQQLSTKAAGTIWGRFEELGPVTPEAIAELPHEVMRGCGLSNAKARYIKDLADAVLTERLELDELDHLDDEAMIEELTQVKGVGRWTAEMFLIFGMGRLDVLSVGDGGILRSAGWLLGREGPADPQELAEAGEAWHPYRSIASLYLWAAIDKGLV